jgi:hypothetical protein
MLGVAALAGRVHNQHDIAVILRQINVFARQAFILNCSTEEPLSSRCLRFCMADLMGAAVPAPLQMTAGSQSSAPRRHERYLRFIKTP